MSIVNRCTHGEYRAPGTRPADPGRGEPVHGGGLFQGRRRPEAGGRARRSWARATIGIQVQRSTASGVRSFGVVQPRACCAQRKACSRPKRWRCACRKRSASSGLAPVFDDHSHTGGASSFDRHSPLSRISVSSAKGGSPTWSSHEKPRVSRGPGPVAPRFGTLATETPSASTPAAPAPSAPSAPSAPTSNASTTIRRRRAELTQDFTRSRTPRKERD